MNKIEQCIYLLYSWTTRLATQRMSIQHFFSQAESEVSWLSSFSTVRSELKLSRVHLIVLDSTALSPKTCKPQSGYAYSESIPPLFTGRARYHSHTTMLSRTLIVGQDLQFIFPDFFLRSTALDLRESRHPDSKEVCDFSERFCHCRDRLSDSDAVGCCMPSHNC